MKVDIEGLQLYTVDFNSGGGSLFMPSSIPLYYVMARSYDEAVQKATIEMEKEPTKSVIDSMGSLTLDNLTPIARAVRLVSDKIIW